MIRDNTEEVVLANGGTSKVDAYDSSTITNFNMATVKIHGENVKHHVG